MGGWHGHAAVRVAVNQSARATPRSRCAWPCHPAILSALLCAVTLAALFAAGCERTDVPAPAGAPTVVTTPSGVAMVRLPGGWFTMGSGAKDQVDEPPHRIWVSPFDIDRFEVTQAEYEKVTGANPAKWKAPRNPVEQIRWAQAAAYCNARSKRDGLTPAYDPETRACDFAADGYRLPTEAEWEYACRAGTTTDYAFGDDPSRLKRYAWCKGNKRLGPRPVGTREPNPWGLYDMAGNVWEWCHDLYAEDYYTRSPERDPTGPPTGKNRVLRGGCWNSRPAMCRAAYRNNEDPGYTDVCFGRDVHGFVGFRCLRRAPASEPAATEPAAVAAGHAPHPGTSPLGEDDPDLPVGARKATHIPSRGR